jgi:hypothetical protein
MSHHTFADYFHVDVVGTSYIVPYSTARLIEIDLETASINTWLEFRDVFGAHHRIPARWIYGISELRQAANHDGQHHRRIRHA